MYGNSEFRLEAKRVSYRFAIMRKISRIIGDSAPGKSELCRLISSDSNPAAGIRINCKYNVGEACNGDRRCYTA